MIEKYEFRVNGIYSNLIPKKLVVKDLGGVIQVVLNSNDHEFEHFSTIAQKIGNKENESFFYGWSIKRNYTKRELDSARLFQIMIQSIFQPTGEECGTEYDESAACPKCGINRNQVGPLRLQEKSIPKKDISSTISGEVIVSNDFKLAFEAYGLKGISFHQVFSKDQPLEYFQIFSTSPSLHISNNTVTGIAPFNFSDSSGNEVYRCSCGYILGLNLLSEVYIKNDPKLSEHDFFMTTQMIGVKRGLYRPEPLFLCSQEFRKMILFEKLKGFGFEIAHTE